VRPPATNSTGMVLLVPDGGPSLREDETLLLTAELLVS
jgi:hypothetical protein